MSKYDNMGLFDLARELIKWADREEILYEFGYKKDSTERMICKNNIEDILEAMKKNFR